MRILCLHANKIRYKATKKAISEPEEIDSKEDGAEECLAVFMSVEKRDEENPEGSVRRLVKEIRKVAGNVNAETVVLYPYVHLTSNPGSPKTAMQVLDLAEKDLGKDFEVKRSPFGWYKSFEIDVKGHPLAELSREFGPEEDKEEAEEDKFELNEEKLSEEKKIKLSTSAVIAKAIKELFPEADIGGMGFYHDQAYVDIAGVGLKQNHFDMIGKRAKKIIKKELKFGKADKADNDFQKEIIEEAGSQAYGLDGTTLAPLHKKPFVKSTGDIGAFKLMHLASAYWKGSADNEQLVRIYSVGFKTEKELEEYEKKLEEAEKRSHVTLGKKLGLFFNDDISPGSPFFLPKGATVVREMQNFLREIYFEEGYKEVMTPTIFSNDLWKTSGHWDHYKDNMFFIEDEDMAVKPMNCPSHCVIYKQDTKSYRDLPLRLADFGILHRNELSGTLHGLTRVRKFQQDDAHVYCTQEQIEEEVENLIGLMDRVYKAFKLNNYEIEISTRPKKAMGSDKLWKTAEKSLKNALEKAGKDFEINEGDGAFYGPKIDFQVTDSLDRSWQLGTIQLDFQMPEKFELEYEGSDGKQHRPVMIHRALLGSLERFFGVLIEHTNGNLPLWLNPVQVKIVTIADRHNEFAGELLQKLRSKKVRAELDDRMESVGKKIRDAQVEKANYMITIGDNELDSGKLAVRDRDGNVEKEVAVEDFIEKITSKIDKRK